MCQKLLNDLPVTKTQVGAESVAVPDRHAKYCFLRNKQKYTKSPNAKKGIWTEWVEKGVKNCVTTPVTKKASWQLIVCDVESLHKILVIAKGAKIRQNRLMFKRRFKQVGSKQVSTVADWPPDYKKESWQQISCRAEWPGQILVIGKYAKIRNIDYC